MRRWIDLGVISATAALLLGGILTQDRWPTGDAAHLLGIASRLARELATGEIGDFFFHGSSLLAPHPPGGYLFPLIPSLFGAGRHAGPIAGVMALALAWHGLRLLVGRDRFPPLAAWAMVLSTPLIWLAVEHSWWDLLAAGCAAATLGHLHASQGLTDRRHSLAFGAFMGLGFLTKYTFPMFVVLPTLWVGLGILFSRRGFRGLLFSVAAFATIAGPWYLSRISKISRYVRDSTDPNSAMVDTASTPLTGAELLQPENLAYYPAVLVEGLGWPGLALLGLGLLGIRHKGGRLALLGALGGLAILSLTGQRQARYLVPALPLLALAMDSGLRLRHRAPKALGALAVLLVVVPATYCTARMWTWIERPPSNRPHNPGLESLATWGTWPWPAEGFRPVSSDPEAWLIEQALTRLAELVGDEPQTIGLFLDEHSGGPGTGFYIWWAEALGHPWDVATVMAKGRGGEPLAFVGPFAGDDWPPKEFAGLYSVRKRGDSALRKLKARFDATEVSVQALPNGYEGTLFSVPDSTWQGPNKPLVPPPLPPGQQP
jgi:hypothetical protein